jgi:hypothetical protein
MRITASTSSAPSARSWIGIDSVIKTLKSIAVNAYQSMADGQFQSKSGT